MKRQFIVGQRVVLAQRGGVEEIGRVVPPERDGPVRGVWVYSPSRGFASDYALCNVRPSVRCRAGRFEALQGPAFRQVQPREPAEAPDLDLLEVLLYGD